MTYIDEILTNGHAGMLNDQHRHKAYRSAIQQAIKKINKRKESVRLLDIGTGSGLLTLYAAEAGADFILACECNMTMANIARSVIKDNKHKFKNSTKIQIEAVSSCDLDTLYPEFTRSFNVIVSEVYDSELIGEGCLITYKHALLNLASDDCVFIPSNAAMFAQPVFSASLDNYCFLPSAVDKSEQQTRVNFKVPWEMHIDKISDVQFGEECQLWKWEFSVEQVESWEGCKNVTIPNEKQCNGVILWWKSDIDAENCISTAPSTHKEFQEFRDHWMPLFYPICKLNSDIHLKVDISDLNVNISHTVCDDCVTSNENKGLSLEMMNYRYLGYMNSSKLNEAYFRCLEKLSHRFKNNVFYVGPASVLPGLIEGKFGCPVKTVNIEEISETIAECKESVIVDSCYDPFSLTSVSYYYRRKRLEKSLLSPDIHLIPNKVVLLLTLVESSQLTNKVLSPDTIDGFDISSFSRSVRQCLSETTGDDMFDPVFPWEYEYRTLSSSTELPSFHQCGDHSSVSLKISESGVVTNALFSLGYYFSDTFIHFCDSDYFNKVDCYTFVDKLKVEKGENVIFDFELLNCQIVSLHVSKS